MRWRKPPEEARDLTQEFFARALEKRYFGGYDATKALFRTYLKASLDRFVMEVGRGERRINRGGSAMRLSLDFDLAEDELEQLGAPGDVEACFDAEWTRHLLSTAVHALEALCQASGKSKYFEVFRRYVLDDLATVTANPDAPSPRPSYGALAADLAISVSDVTNYLSWTRREFRRLVLEALREITSSDEEFRSEARIVLGVEP